MSAPTPQELLEERAGELGVSSQDLFELWFRNHTTEDLQSRVDELRNHYPDMTTEQLALEMLDDVVDIWLEDAEEENS